MVFMLACVAGFYVVWNVSHRTSHAFNVGYQRYFRIIIVGALLQIGRGGGFVTFLAFIAV